jgi:hypothetical protein
LHSQLIISPTFSSLTPTASEKDGRHEKKKKQKKDKARSARSLGTKYPILMGSTQHLFVITGGVSHITNLNGKKNPEAVTEISEIGGSSLNQGNSLELENIYGSDIHSRKLSVFQRAAKDATLAEIQLWLSLRHLPTISNSNGNLHHSSTQGRAIAREIRRYYKFQLQRWPGNVHRSSENLSKKEISEKEMHNISR